MSGHEIDKIDQQKLLEDIDIEITDLIRLAKRDKLHLLDYLLGEALAEVKKQKEKLRIKSDSNSDYCG